MKSYPKNKVVPREVLIPFILVTILFPLWGFANDITNPMVAAFQRVLEISTTRATLVQFAFYGGYATMALPAALFIQKFTYKRGIILGLALYSIGAFLFYPAAKYEVFGFFLIALYILTFGLAFLETVANPFILSMGSPETATRRLNLSQAFNPMGSLLGMFVASQFILRALHSDNTDQSGNLLYETMNQAEKAVVRTHDLMLIRNPYLILGGVVLLLLILILLVKMPAIEHSGSFSLKATLSRLLNNPRYKWGVVAQIFYVGAQIMCWTFVIHYAANLGIAYDVAQKYNMIAMGFFLSGRFIGTFLMRYVKSGTMLMVFSSGALICMIGTIGIQGMAGLYALMACSVFMSIMFPTIYGIALNGLEEDAKIGSAGLVMAIVGGALMPLIQASIIDMGTVWGMPSVNVSFLVPLSSFIVIGLYGFHSRDKTLDPADS